MVNVDELSCDVLVIGSGAAGLMAAIEARRKGVDVVLASKTSPGYSTCTMYSAGAFRVAVNSYGVEKHFNDTLAGGGMLNSKALVWRMVNEAPKRIPKLLDLGVKLAASGGYIFIGKPPYPGYSIVNPLVKAAGSLGVKFLSNTIVTDIVKEGEEVLGVIALDLEKMRILAVSAKAVVLAAGGCGQVYLRTDNPLRITGDGYALGLQVGVELIDMEFIQFFPLGLADGAIWMIPVSRGKLENSLGEDILQKYGLNVNLHEAIIMMRDKLSRAIMLEAKAGRNVILDYSEALNNPDRLTKIALHVLSRLKKTVVKILPLAHFAMGGIKINENAETSLKGLYACGEVAGGIHGANRIGGNALTEAVVFGSIAGEEAARRALECKINKIDLKHTFRLKEELGKLGEGVYSPREVKNAIKNLAWNLVGIIRSGEGLRQALNMLKTIEQYRVKARNRIELLEAFEALSMVKTVKAITLSALTRTESRGAHFREDYPNEDGKWLKNIVIRLENSEFKVDVKPLTT